MNRFSCVLLLALTLAVSCTGHQSAVELVEDIYRTCLSEFSLSCAKSKTLGWFKETSNKRIIRITDDLDIRKSFDIENEVERGNQRDVLDRFEDFLQSHEIVAKLPGLLRPDGPFGQFIPRSFEARDISLPLAPRGHASKLIKRVIFPFLLGLKFKTAVIVPLALALIALKTWKALTLGLLSLVLTGAITIFSKLLGPKAPAYEVLHYQPHVAYPHVDVLPAQIAPTIAHPVLANLSAGEVLQDVYYTCVQEFDLSCVKPKALHWLSDVAEDEEIRITENLMIVKRDNPQSEKERGFSNDVFEKFEDFLQTHDLVLTAPEFIPRSLGTGPIKVPLAETGKYSVGRSSKVVKKVILPFLLGLKFKAAVLVPLALALIALKTWKALTLGLLSLVLTGALLIFKFTKPKVVNYEVIHVPPHVEHVEHLDHPPTASGWEHPGYGRQLTGNEMAYNAYL
ncbi:unnamed protein product [Phyllotreta striolata]|uniref:Osiris 18 n=1 Tax=Phyllotreta striolata TaxID=444603 RepID=A0A9N9TR28_PHYSR|nr:unnamed protein product [Phyllotreta striolata]